MYISFQSTLIRHGWLDRSNIAPKGMKISSGGRGRKTLDVTYDIEELYSMSVILKFHRGESS